MSFEQMPGYANRRTARAASLLTLGLALATAPGIIAQRLEKTEAHDATRFYSDDPVWRDSDMTDIQPVTEFDLSKSYEFVHETFGESVKSHGRALNVNTLDEVPDSSWFTNRLGRFDMTIDEIVRGPNQNEGPASGTWLVTGRPDSGITPKFSIRDSRGDTYLIKLDPANFPELPSSVEVISTKIFHAIGYHVPEDFIVTFDASQLVVAEGATIRMDTGEKRAIRLSDVNKWLAHMPRTADGRIRALASRWVPGKVVGQFRFTGTRPDDPNDIYPHERRRELRGLKVFAAWLNHDDARSINSIDSYVEVDGRRFIRHYLQDFGSNLGSGSTSAQQPRGGYEYLIEGDKIAKGLFSFGLYTRDWARVRYPADPSLGNIEAEFFEPWKWKTEYPQPAFNQMDDADAFWAASIASRFTDSMLGAIVATGRLSNPEAERKLTDILIRRRDKVVAYWITKTNPLDRFEIREKPTGPELAFDNAAARLQLANPSGNYSARWLALDNTTGSERVSVPDAQLAGAHTRIPGAAWGPADASGVRYAVVMIETNHPDFPAWQRPVRVTVRNRNGAIDVVGIERPTGAKQ
jgi:hypothetical protein